jgi:hypothetical protein
MPSTNDYFINLKTMAESAALAKKQALDTAYEMATQAKVNKDTGEITYNKDASGQDKLGTADVAYKEKQRSTATSGEAGGMLRSGQQARQKLMDESDYRARILSLAQDKTAQQSQIDTDTATKIAEYRAMYGTGAASTSSSSTTQQSKATDLKPITEVPKEPGSTTKPVVYSPAAVSQIQKAYAPAKTATPAPKKSTPAPKKTLTPKRIGGY